MNQSWDITNKLKAIHIKHLTALKNHAAYRRLAAYEGAVQALTVTVAVIAAVLILHFM